MKSPIKFDSLSVGIPFFSVSFKIANDAEIEIVKELLIRSDDKRFLTSWQCCSNCTKYAIDSVLDYRKLLVDEKVKLSNVKDSKLSDVIDYILRETKQFLSISEQHDLELDQKYLSEQLGILRSNVLATLKKFCGDNGITYPKGLFNLLRDS